VIGGLGTFAALFEANFVLRRSYVLPLTLLFVGIIGFSYLMISKSRFLIVKSTGFGLSSKFAISWGIFEVLALADISLRLVGSLVARAIFGLIFDMT